MKKLLLCTLLALLFTGCGKVVPDVPETNAMQETMQTATELNAASIAVIGSTTRAERLQSP